MPTIADAASGLESNPAEDYARAKDFLTGYLVALGAEAQHLGTIVEIEAQIERRLVELNIRNVELLIDVVARMAARLSLSPGAGVVLLKRGAPEPESPSAGKCPGGQGMVPVKLRMIEQLMRRLEQRARHSSLPEQRKEASGIWTYDMTRWELIASNGNSVTLSMMESQIVHCLISRCCHVVARDEMLAALNRPHLAYRRNLDMIVSRLRKKVDEHCGAKLPIAAARGVGYVFSAPAVMLELSRHAGEHARS